MIFFLSVMFVCGSDACTFMQSDTKFMKQAECVEVTKNAVLTAREKGLIAEGTCLAINTKDLV